MAPDFARAAAQSRRRSAPLAVFVRRPAAFSAHLPDAAAFATSFVRRRPRAARAGYPGAARPP